MTECDDDSQPPAQLQGSCSICFEDLRQSDKISAIVCGHIYHHGCISQWMAAKKQCPSCRRAVPKNGFVEKLFFDVQRLGGETAKIPEIDYREEHYKLTTSLKVEKEKLELMETENKTLKTEVKSLEKKVIREKDKYKAEIPKLQATINHLTISSEETGYLKRELSEAKNRVKASEFYKILMTHSDQGEKHLGEYLRRNGSLDTEKFFQLQKSQIKNLTEQRREAAKEIESLKTEAHVLRRKAQDDAAIIKTLKQSVLELRERGNVDTPITNKRLRAVLETDTPPAAKRKSLGFDESSQLIENDLSYFKQQENKTPVVSKPSTSAFNFDDDDDDEYFRTPKIAPKIVPKKTSEERKKPSDDSFDFDIPVPAAIISRMPSKILKIKPLIPKSAYLKKQQAQKLTEDPLPKPIPSKLTEKSTNVPPIRRYQSVDVLKTSPPDSTTTSQKNARISSFFTRTTSSTAMKEYVTLD